MMSLVYLVARELRPEVWRLKTSAPDDVGVRKAKMTVTLYEEMGKGT